VTHPNEPRKFSIDELRRLSGFPADFVLTGTYSQQWERIGRAVPPPMMAALARGVLSVLNGSAGRNDEL
jgi:DNA (cytosine-5)-methyltransferase 1